MLLAAAQAVAVARPEAGKEFVMSELKRLVNDAENEAVSVAIQQAEEKSGCEIIPVLALASGRYDRGEDVFGVVFAMLLVALAWQFVPALLPSDLPQNSASPLGWSYGQAAPFGLLALLVIFGGGFLLGALMATRISILKVPFTARQEMREEVARAAQACFYSRGLRKAPGAAGVLIYVSHFERMVEIIGDDAVAAKLSDEDWQSICAALLDGLKQGRAADGFVAALDKTGDLLDGAFARPDDGLRFADELVLLDE